MDIDKTQGFVKLWRCFMDERIFANKDLWHLWTWMLMKANHGETWEIINKGSGAIEIKVSNGQFVFGRKSASKALKEKPTTIWKRLQKLKTLGFCDIQSDMNGSIVTICNYKEMFESADRKVTPGSESALKDGERSLEDRHTYKNLENLKNLKKETKAKKVFDPGSRELLLANLLWSWIQKNNETAKKPDLLAWAREFDLVLRLDKRSYSQARDLIEACQKDDFWKHNILSPAKFRKHYDQLNSKLVLKSDGPKEGDNKQKGGVNYVFRSDKWIRINENTW